MAFNGSFQLNRTSNKNAFQLVDTSAGSDPNLLLRLITVTDYTGAVITANFLWPIVNSSITLDILSTDKAINISVFWQSSDALPSPSTYAYDQIYAMTAYGRDFLYQLTQMQASNPNILQDQNYYDNKNKLITDLVSAEDAITVGESIANSQVCMDRYLFLMSKQNLFF
jgi:hypothetical protein